MTSTIPENLGAELRAQWATRDLDALAADLGLRYRQAFGGQPGLQAALKRQKVDLRRLPARLAKALQAP